MNRRSGITVVRIMMAIVFIVSGFLKWRAGLGAVTAYFTKMAIPIPGIAAPIVPTLELAGGICLALGLLTRVFGVWFTFEMLVTAFYVKFRTGQYWDPVRIDLMLLAAAVMLILAGPGRLALDNLWLEKRTDGAPSPRARRSP